MTQRIKFFSLGLLTLMVATAGFGFLRDDNSQPLPSHERINHPEWHVIRDKCEDSHPDAHMLWSFYSERGRKYDEVHSKGEDCTVYTDMVMHFSDTNKTTMEAEMLLHPLTDYIGPKATQLIDGRTSNSGSMEVRISSAGH